MQIGVRLREEREKLRLTQTEMAKICGVAFRTYCDYEASKTEPKASLLMNLNKIDVDVMYILTGCRILQKNISVDETSLLDNYRSMSPAARLNVLAVAAAFAKSESPENREQGC
ncbi:helix-turn-helix transcriptional regulator [Morganella morganii subsp. morganii]|uniref:helix-turn-helix domain-containing protein n=1 Tax=Morganella morganii TaxID=582 RepID=UPI001BD9434A|nr:helix-turn-helix transcriptional regulator [Morganella morganii]MBT0351738.1 helix-turn-helix transcriptional regulator [Morganella morganii subsp. morganii]